MIRNNFVFFLNSFRKKTLKKKYIKTIMIFFMPKIITIRKKIIILIRKLEKKNKNELSLFTN